MSAGVLTLENCSHANTKRGEDMPLVYGSARTEVCVDCGSFRQRTHHDEVPMGFAGRWRQASEYDDAIRQDDE